MKIKKHTSDMMRAGFEMRGFLEKGANNFCTA